MDTALVSLFLDLACGRTYTGKTTMGNGTLSLGDSSAIEGAAYSDESFFYIERRRNPRAGGRRPLGDHPPHL